MGRLVKDLRINELIRSLGRESAGLAVSGFFSLLLLRAPAISAASADSNVSRWSLFRVAIRIPLVKLTGRAIETPTSGTPRLR